MYEHFYLSEIHTVSTLDSKTENRSIEFVNVVWFLKITCYDILRSNLTKKPRPVFTKLFNLDICLNLNI